MFVLGNLIAALTTMLDYALTIANWLIIIRALLSWVNPDPYNVIVQFLYKVTDPLLAPFRRFFPSYSIGDLIPGPGPGIGYNANKREASMKDLIPKEIIERKIYLVRGRNVMLDKDLAGLYGVETKNLNLQVKRNIKRFPNDFMLLLTRQEVTNLRLQFTTSSYGGQGSCRSDRGP